MCGELGYHQCEINLFLCRQNAWFLYRRVWESGSVIFFCFLHFILPIFFYEGIALYDPCRNHHSHFNLFCITSLTVNEHHTWVASWKRLAYQFFDAVRNTTYGGNRDKFSIGFISFRCWHENLMNAFFNYLSRSLNLSILR